MWVFKGPRQVEGPVVSSDSSSRYQESPKEASSRSFGDEEESWGAYLQSLQYLALPSTLHTQTLPSFSLNSHLSEKDVKDLLTF